MLTPSLQQERAQLLQEMAGIDSMVRGHLSQQIYQRKSAGRLLTHGPYHLLQRHANGKNNCQRIGPEELAFISQAVAGHARFQALARRYAELTEQATWEGQPSEIKKKFRRFSRPTSPRPSSA